MKALPEGWVSTKLGQLIELSYGRGLPEKDRRPGPYTVFGSNGAVGSHKEAITEAPAIIVGRKGSIGEIHFSNDRCYPIDTTYFIDRFNGNEPHFIEYMLRLLPLKELDRATAIPGLNRDDAYQLDVPLPPLAEQRRIVSKLDHLLARTTRAHADLDRIPVLIAKYKEALLAAAFSGELTRDWRNEQSSDDWEFVRAGDLFTWASGKFLPKKDQRDGPIPVFGGNGVNGHHDQALYSQPTIVIGRVGAHCGNVHLTLGPAWITDNAIYATSINDRVNPKFAFLVLRESRLNTRSGGTGQPYVNQEHLNAVTFTLPPMIEQDEIVRRVDTASLWLNAVAAEHGNAVRLLPKLDQAISAKAFRGELVPQDPGDEPASELLARILGTRSEPPNRRRARKPRSDVVPRAPRERAAMTKSRDDDDVRNKPYLADLLRQTAGSGSVEDLFKRADLTVADFYKQLKWEVDSGHIRDDRERLEAA